MSQVETGPMPFALAMDGITMRFGGVLALDGVSLRVRRGDVHGLLGQNGAGKSTLVKILSGYHPAGSYAGTITVAGSPVQLRSPADAYRRGISFVPQETTVVDPLTVAENVAMATIARSRRAGFSPGEIKKRVAAFLDDRHISLNPSARVSELSVHEKQLVMIARSLITNPEVLVLDEPTSSLSQEETDNLFSLVREMKQRGETCVFITHKINEAEQLCDRVTVLRDGRVAADLDRQEFDRAAIIGAMIGRRLGEMYPAIPPVASDAPVVLAVDELDVVNPRAPDRTILNGISLQIRAGEILGLAGLVGSGRSELVNALYGRIPTRRGIVRIGETQVRPRDPGEALSSGIALVTEDRRSDGIMYPLSIRENVTLHDLKELARGPLLRRSLEAERASQAVGDLRIVPRSIAANMRKLSGGNQQKVVLGKVLMPGPRVLLLDEPTKGVDVGAKAEIYRILARLAETGVAMLLVSTELPELIAMSHRIAILANGTIRQTVLPSEVDEQSLLNFMVP